MDEKQALIHTFKLQWWSRKLSDNRLHQIPKERKAHEENQYIIEQLAAAPKVPVWTSRLEELLTSLSLQDLFSFSLALFCSPSSVNEVDVQSLVAFLFFFWILSQEDCICMFVCYLAATAIQTETRGLACCGDLCLCDPQLRE